MSFVILLISLIILILAFSYYSFRICFYCPRKRTESLTRPPDGEQYTPVAQRMLEISLIMESAPCEYVQIKSRDGLMLNGRYYEYYPGAPLMIAFHGYRSMALRDCAGAFALSQKLGFNILAVDQRGHGKSEGSCLTFGIRERYDCLRWVHYANRRFGSNKPILLSGISMGAATVLMASSLPLPNNVLGILADCPYSSPEEIIYKVSVDKGYPRFLAAPIIRLGAWLFGKLNLKESTALDAVRHAQIPILLIHGEDDRFVPCDMSKRIYENCASSVKLHTFPGAGHGLCYIHDPRRYEKVCVQFLWQLEPLRAALSKSELVRKILNL